MKWCCLFGTIVLMVGMLRMVKWSDRDKNKLRFFWNWKPTKMKTYYLAWSVLLVLKSSMVLYFLLGNTGKGIRPEVFHNKGFLIVKLTGKELYLNLFWNKISGWRSVTLSKRDFGADFVSVNTEKFFRTSTL